MAEATAVLPSSGIDTFTRLDLAASMAIYPPVHSDRSLANDETPVQVGQVRDKLFKLQTLAGYDKLTETAGLFTETGLIEHWVGEFKAYDRTQAVGAIGLLHGFVDATANAVTVEDTMASLPEGTKVPSEVEVVDELHRKNKNEVARQATLMGGKVISAFSVFDDTNIEVINNYILMPTVNDLVHLRYGNARSQAVRRVRALGNPMPISL